MTLLRPTKRYSLPSAADRQAAMEALELEEQPMERVWEPEQLIACWTLDEADWQLLANKTGPTRLGFALLLKFFDLEGRFPAHAGELPQVAVDYVAGLVKVPAGELGRYGWSGRTRSSITAVKIGDHLRVAGGSHRAC